MDKTILKQLEHFGFTAVQAKLYLAGLMKKRVLMKPLAKTSGVKRTTAIYLMQELLRRGFFSTKKIRKRIYYIASTPEHLLKITEKRKQLILKLLPKLKKL